MDDQFKLGELSKLERIGTLEGKTRIEKRCDQNPVAAFRIRKGRIPESKLKIYSVGNRTRRRGNDDDTTTMG